MRTQMTIGVTVSTMRLYNGRRSLYVAISLPWRVLWLQRWDTVREPRNRFRSGDMGWVWGSRKAV